MGSFKYWVLLIAAILQKKSTQYFALTLLWVVFKVKLCKQNCCLGL